LRRGYDFIVDSGLNIESVLLSILGDNTYDLWLWDDPTGSFVDSGTDLQGGSRYDFAAGGVDAFRLAGIETDLFVDPLDTSAFATGLTFMDVGIMSMRQIPLTLDVPDPVPTPTAFVLGSIGLAYANWRLKRRKAA